LTHVSYCIAQVHYHIIVVAILVAEIQLEAAVTSLENGRQNLSFFNYMIASKLLSEWDTEIAI
jgi:hypothetical protein